MNRKFIAHRGISNCYPENTLIAYKYLKDNNFDYGECDVTFTKDDIPILLHDDKINRTSNKKGKICDLFYDDIKEYDFGSWFNEKFVGERIPLFSDFLRLCKTNNIKPYVEIKKLLNIEKHINILIDISRKLEMENDITWISFSIDVLKEINKYSNARLGLLIKKLDFNNIDVIKFLNLRKNKSSLFINHKFNKLNKKIINECKKRGIELEAWTLNSKKEYMRLDDYISGVTCNYYLG